MPIKIPNDLPARTVLDRERVPVITEDVAPDALALGRARQVEKPGWAERFRAAKAAMPRKRV